MKVTFEDKTVAEVYPSNRNIHQVHAIITACKSILMAFLDNLHVKEEEECVRFFSSGQEIARYTPSRKEWEVF